MTPFHNGGTPKTVSFYTNRWDATHTVSRHSFH